MLRTFKQQIIRGEQRSGKRNIPQRRQFNRLLLKAGGQIQYCKLPQGVKVCPLCQKPMSFPFNKCKYCGYTFEDKPSCTPPEYMGVFWDYVEKHKIMEDDTFNENIPTLSTLWEKETFRPILKKQIHELIRMTCHEYGWWGPLRWLASMDIESWEKKLQTIQSGSASMTEWEDKIRRTKTFISESQRLINGITQGDKTYALEPPKPEYHVGATKILSLKQIKQVKDFIENDVVGGNLNNEIYPQATRIHGNSTTDELDEEVYKQYYENAQLYWYIQHFKLRQRENDEFSFSFTDDDKEKIPTCIGLLCTNGDVVEISHSELAKYLLKLIEFLLAYFHKLIYLDTSNTPWTESSKTEVGKLLHDALKDLNITVS